MFSCKMFRDQCLAQYLTRTLTQMRKSPDSTGQDVSHGICRHPLRCGSNVGVSVQGEARGVVAQHTANCFHIRPGEPVLQRCGGGRGSVSSANL